MELRGRNRTIAKDTEAAEGINYLLLELQCCTVPTQEFSLVWIQSQSNPIYITITCFLRRQFLQTHMCKPAICNSQILIFPYLLWRSDHPKYINLPAPSFTLTTNLVPRSKSGDSPVTKYTLYLMLYISILSESWSSFGLKVCIPLTAIKSCSYFFSFLTLRLVASFMSCRATSSLRHFFGRVTRKYLRMLSKSNCSNSRLHICYQNGTSSPQCVWHKALKHTMSGNTFMKCSCIKYGSFKIHVVHLI